MPLSRLWDVCIDMYKSLNDYNDVKNLIWLLYKELQRILRFKRSPCQYR